MKIIYDHKIFWNQRYGGISRYFINLIKNLEKYENIKYKFVSPFYKNKYLNREIKKENIFGKYIDSPLPKTSFFLEKFNKLFFKHFANKFNPDLIHSTYYNKDIIKKKPIVLTIYDLIHEKISKKENNLKLPKFEALKLADHIICISNETKKDLIEFYKVDEKKINVIYLGFDHFPNTLVK